MPFFFLYSLYDGFSVLHVCSLYEKAFRRRRFLQYSLKVLKVWIYLLISVSLFERQIPLTQILRSLFSFFVLALCQDKQSSLF